MAQGKKKKRQLEDVDKEQQLNKRMRVNQLPEELIQVIQSALPSKDAQQTCVLSKSWLHAWSTRPSFRWYFPDSLLKDKPYQRRSMRWIHLALLRYHRLELPITSVDLQLGLHANHERVFQKLIKQAITYSEPSLTDLRLGILSESFCFPDEIFSNQNLHSLRLELIFPFVDNHRSLHIPCNPPVLCTNLRVLELSHVHISSKILNQLLSQNKLLEKLFLGVTPSLDEIKVHNLPYLREFEVCLGRHAWIDFLEIRDAPSLRLLVFNTPFLFFNKPPSSFDIHTIGSLKILQLDNIYIDDAFSKLIKSSFPFLEELTLEIKWFSVEILDITSLTLRELKLYFLRVPEINIQVSAPNLVTYTHGSSVVRFPLFTTTPPEQIHISFFFNSDSDDESFFLKMRETLKLSSKFNIVMSSHIFGVSDFFINVDDVKTLVPHPATNVEKLVLEEYNDVSGENSLLLDAVFSTCHPMYTKANAELAKYFLKLILKGVMENCEIRSPLDGRWVALTRSSLNLLDTTTPGGFYEFKPSWCSP